MKRLTIKELKTEFKANGVKQVDLAKRLGVTKDYVNRILTERTPCPETFKIKLETYLELKKEG